MEIRHHLEILYSESVLRWMQQSDVILNVDAFEVVYGLIALYYIGNFGESMCEKKEHVCVPTIYVCLIIVYTGRNGCGITHLVLLLSLETNSSLLTIHGRHHGKDHIFT